MVRAPELLPSFQPNEGMREGSYSAAWISVTTTRPLRRIHCGLRHERPGCLVRSAAVGEAAGFQHVCHQMPWERAFDGWGNEYGVAV